MLRRLCAAAAERQMRDPYTRPCMTPPSLPNNCLSFVHVLAWHNISSLLHVCLWCTHTGNTHTQTPPAVRPCGEWSEKHTSTKHTSKKAHPRAAAQARCQSAHPAQTAAGPCTCHTGSHTCTHPIYTDCAREQKVNERCVCGRAQNTLLGM